MIAMAFGRPRRTSALSPLVTARDSMVTASSRPGRKPDFQRVDRERAETVRHLPTRLSDFGTDLDYTHQTSFQEGEISGLQSARNYEFLLPPDKERVILLSGKASNSTSELGRERIHSVLLTPGPRALDSQQAFATKRGGAA